MAPSDPPDLGSGDVWASYPVEPFIDEAVAARAPVDLGDGVVLTGWAGGHGRPCVEGRVPRGGGFWPGPEGGDDYCAACYRVERDDNRAPTPDEQVAQARRGIAGGAPVVIDLCNEPANLESLERLVAEHHVERVLITGAPEIVAQGSIVFAADDPRLVSSSLRQFELHLLGRGFGPPIDPDLQARMDAAADEHGVIHDAALADEVFADMVARQEQHRRELGLPEVEAAPDVVHGRIFPTVAGDPTDIGELDPTVFERTDDDERDDPPEGSPVQVIVW